MKKTKKMIKEPSKKHRVKSDWLTAVIGCGLMLIGLLCFIIKALSGEYVDKYGILHEKFFLLPVGYAFLLLGLIILIIAAALYFKRKK